MSDIEAVTVAYRAAKAIKAGQKLWCMWSEKDPYTGYVISSNTHKTGFVLDRPEDMRKMAADLFRLADSIDELENMWQEDQ